MSPSSSFGFLLLLLSKCTHKLLFHVSCYGYDLLDEWRSKSWNNTIESVGGGSFYIVKLCEFLHCDAQLGGSENVSHILLILCAPSFVLHVLCFILYVLE